MADAEAEQEARCFRLPLRFDRREKVVDGFCFPPFATEEFGAMAFEAIDVRGRVQPAKFDELGNGLLAQSLDVERTARDEMPKSLETLRGADEPAGTAYVDLAFLRNGFAPTFRAM